MPTEKRQRQKAGRQARLAAEQKVPEAQATLRRIITVVIVAAVVFGISYAIFKPGEEGRRHHHHHDHDDDRRPCRRLGQPAPSAITTSADCPANFSATSKPAS